MAIGEGERGLFIIIITQIIIILTYNSSISSYFDAM